MLAIPGGHAADCGFRLGEKGRHENLFGTPAVFSHRLISIFAVIAVGINVFHPPFDGSWTARLLILAAWVIVPLGLKVIGLDRLGTRVDRLGRIARIMQFLCVLLLAYALLQPQDWTSAMLAGPYLAATAVVAVWGLLRAWQHRRGPMGDLCIDVGLIYLVVGGFWAVLDRAGLQPLDFDPAIVLLTAVHFHYAGFTLLLLTSLVAQSGDRLSQVNCIAVVVAVPLVAVGITTTQLGFSPAIECLAAWGMAVGGLLTAVQYFRLSSQRRWPVFMRGCWFVVAVACFQHVARRPVRKPAFPSNPLARYSVDAGAARHREQRRGWTGRRAGLEHGGEEAHRA